MASTWRAGSAVVVDHIEYIIKRVGIRHVAIGSDYDGWLPAIPSDQRNCRDVHSIGEQLIQRGYAVEDVSKIMSENAFEMLRHARPEFE